MMGEGLGGRKTEGSGGTGREDAPANRERVLRIIARILLVCCILFIFSNSLRNGEESNLQSGRLLALLYRLLGVEFPPVFIRKLAHFTEFAAEGFLFVLSVRGDRLRRRLPAPACLLTACLDESLQLFTEGRAGRLTDVGIDTAGALFGIGVCWACILAARRLYRQRGLLR